MLKVILGEMLEHKRLFDQAAGRQGLIGTSLAINDHSGAVMPVRCRTVTTDVTVAIALGSNLGDREANLAFGLSAFPVSSPISDNPAGTTPPGRRVADQPRYLNGVVVGRRADARASCSIDCWRSKTRPAHAAAPMAPRTLDLD
jgi:hypothetical protein